MKGLEDMPMRAMNERVRDAFSAAAETVTAQDLPGLPAPAARSWAARGLRAWAPRVRMHALVPAAAAASVAVIVVTAALVVPKLPAGPPGGRAAAFARVPRYFVALTSQLPGGPAVVGATATGAVLGTVAPPRSYPLFTMVAAGGDGRTFVFAAARDVGSGTARLYRLVLRRSGHPGRLTPLPIPPQTGGISGLAVSPDGSKLAVSVLGFINPHDPSKIAHGPSKISVFSLATGAERDWAWPGKGQISWDASFGVVNAFAARSLSWEADNRTLLFEVRTGTRTSINAQARLLDTAAPAGSLLAASTRVPIPSAELAPRGKNPPIALNAGPLLITGDGTRIVAVTWHTTSHGGPAQRQRTFTFNGTISEFSVRTGKPVQVVYQLRLRREPDAPDVLWVNGSGTVMIASHPLPGSSARSPVVGVQTLTTFTPLPASVQHYFRTVQPAW